MTAFFSSFLVPAAFGLLALLPLIVLMYLLKLRRRPQQVPSTLLWRRSVLDLIANAPFQRLRNNLLLWLQLLILLLLILALARPMLKLGGSGGETIILMLDLSASMQTEESDGETRLEKAKTLALQTVDNMSGGENPFARLGKQDEMLILGFSDTPIPLQSMTQDKALLRSAIRGAEARDTQTNLTDAAYILEEKAMITRDGAIEPNPKARVILISDGGIGPTGSELREVLNIDFTTVGAATDNAGFTSIDVRESFTGTFEYQIFSSLFNATDSDYQAFVELDVDGEILDLKQVDIPARGQAAVVFSVGESISGLATLRLVDHQDALELDNEIRANVSPPTQLDILLVSRGNQFLEAVLSVDPRANVSVMNPADYQPGGEYEITVFDNYSPDELAAGNFIFINSLPPVDTGYREMGERIERPDIIDWSRVHPITRYTNFERVIIFGTAINMQAPADAEPLVDAAETDIISYHETELRRILVIGFDITESLWPVDVSFPIFFPNLIDYWSRTAHSINKPAFATGATVPIVPPRDASKATVTKPDGTRVDYPLEGRATVYLTDTADAGLYSVQFDDGPETIIPINLMSVLESNIRIVDELQLPGRTVIASKDEIKSRQEIWPWLALAALGILMVEWAIYCKRTFM